MYNFVDVHTHLELPEFDHDREAVIKRAFDSNISFLCTVGIEPKFWKIAKEIAERYEKIYFSVGLHPHEAKIYNKKIEEELISYLKHQKCLMLGEIGLDFYKNYSPREKQIEVFIKQLELAEKLQKDVIIHIRDAHKEAKEILKNKSLGGIIHCFSGDLQDAKDYIKMGFYISIPGTITYKNAETLKEVVKNIPLDFILTETDAPFLTPNPLRGKRNEPAFVKYTTEFIAKIKGLSIEDTARTIYVNTMKVFNLPFEYNSKYVYKIRNALYLNLTNRCTNKCVFCGKQKDFFVKGHYLKLEHEPSIDEIIEELPQDLSTYDEIVFCGYGEPTLRLKLIYELSKELRNRKAKKIRLNTDGLANIREKRNIVPELSNYIDSISISLNACDEETYNRICHPSLNGAFQSLIDFIKESKKHIKEVTVSAVAIPDLDMEKIKKFAERELGVKFRERPYDELG
ncbi:MAG: YchF/TatD family DNA exonuclease [Proteobacteria bacterium]|nr:YchF/TatD family DNA exonuclease [Pseudomonadota bacterium]